MSNRIGGKTGGGGAATAQQEAIDRKERLRKLALETIDIRKDPYFLRNHIGQYECKLCLTIHPNEGNYLAHTQGKRHQQNLMKRAALDAQQQKSSSLFPQPQSSSSSLKRKGITIGRPGYRITKHRDPATEQRSLLIEIDYTEIEEGLQPRHRFMSAYEQKIEQPDKTYQYVLFAADPYETIGFKVPNWEIDRTPGKFYTNWDPITKRFTLQVFFIPRKPTMMMNTDGSSNRNI